MDSWSSGGGELLRVRTKVGVSLRCLRWGFMASCDLMMGLVLYWSVTVYPLQNASRQQGHKLDTKVCSYQLCITQGWKKCSTLKRGDFMIGHRKVRHFEKYTTAAEEVTCPHRERMVASEKRKDCTPLN